MVEKEMRRARIWGWGDDFELVKTNCEKYVKKMWKGEVKECAVIISGWDRENGIIFDVVAYARKPEIVGDLAQRMFDVAFNLENDVKVDAVTVILAERMLSEEESYLDDFERVEKEYEEYERILMKKVSENEKVKAKAEGKKISVEFMTRLRCELESSLANKVTIDAHNLSLQKVKRFIDSLNKSLIEEKVAKCVVGFKLLVDPEDYEIEDIYVSNNEIYVELMPASTRVVTK